MRERQSDSPAVSFDELFVNLELQSIFRLGAGDQNTAVGETLCKLNQK